MLCKHQDLWSDRFSKRSYPERAYILAFFVLCRSGFRRWAWPRFLSLSFLMFWKPFVRLRYLLRVTFYSVSRFQTGFHGGYHSPFHFRIHSVCRFELFHSVRRFQLLWHVSPSRCFFSACVAFQLAISGGSGFHSFHGIFRILLSIFCVYSVCRLYVVFMECVAFRLFFFGVCRLPVSHF